MFSFGVSAIWCNFYPPTPGPRCRDRTPQGAASCRQRRGRSTCQRLARHVVWCVMSMGHHVHCQPHLQDGWFLGAFQEWPESLGWWIITVCADLAVNRFCWRLGLLWDFHKDSASIWFTWRMDTNWGTFINMSIRYATIHCFLQKEIKILNLSTQSGAC